ncbi:hypothetical protein RRG08_012666 [Elysia crispata]|uniref:Uncharacterized protein n=1 Tax=Elysia crispata TaxID=231223 RepID=A0AAE1D206_9GAST|nr:hypothetical protein RRG08_012666 [Elysia crispata]
MTEVSEAAWTHCFHGRAHFYLQPKSLSQRQPVRYSCRLVPHTRLLLFRFINPAQFSEKWFQNQLDDEFLSLCNGSSHYILELQFVSPRGLASDKRQQTEGDVELRDSGTVEDRQQPHSFTGDGEAWQSLIDFLSGPRSRGIQAQNVDFSGFSRNEQGHSPIVHESLAEDIRCHLRSTA